MKYLLLGMIPNNQKRFNTDRLNHDICEIAKSDDVKAIIAAACAAIGVQT